ncbi:hypothetical protein [Chenggangzhangella methanolivorans]|uniref:Uncharacterized protein n=1 Tax=Chenggangzhangella methanolivorans TaxID=1437009 RepID=A0A9E6R995_9HYPH|nr:hypothetical protein [Chenggangzhangella methanolivorans]QZN99876.1 hypothetical protein K6K41_25075 [Chenggangzhangella methanolivorans]
MLIAAGRTSRVMLLAAFAASAAIWAPPAFAQQSGAPSQTESSAGDLEPKQVPLQGKQVEAFIAAWPEFEALREKLAAANPQAKEQDKNPQNQPESDEAEVGEAEDPIGALAAYLDDAKAKPQIEEILKKHGFATYSDWADVAQSVLLAFGASDPDGGGADLAAEKKKVQDEINGDAALSEDEKKSALKDLDEQFAALESFQPLPGNVDAVKPYLDKIKDLFGDDETDPGSGQKP